MKNKFEFSKLDYYVNWQKIIFVLQNLKLDY